MTAYRVGAVAYHPRVVTIWEGFRGWFAGEDFPIEYTLFSTYERQLDALFDGEIDVAWNTNLAYVRAKERGDCRPLAMRDTDRNWTSHAVAPHGQLSGLEALRHKRVGFGDADSPQAYILPIYGMKQQGLDPFSDLELHRLDRDIGKHGDTGGAEVAQLERLQAGELDASIISDPTLKALQAEGGATGLEIAWTTPPFHHCNFTALTESDADHATFTRLLLAMRPDEPELAQPMRLEWVNRWIEPDEAGYSDLIAAVRSGLASMP